MSPIAIAKRLATLEDEVAKLKSKLKAFDATKPWWEGIAGTFENDPVYAGDETRAAIPAVAQTWKACPKETITPAMLILDSALPQLSGLPQGPGVEGGGLDHLILVGTRNVRSPKFRAPVVP